MKIVVRCIGILIFAISAFLVWMGVEFLSRATIIREAAFPNGRHVAVPGGMIIFQYVWFILLAILILTILFGGIFLAGGLFALQSWARTTTQVIFSIVPCIYLLVGVGMYLSHVRYPRDEIQRLIDYSSHAFTDFHVGLRLLWAVSPVAVSAFIIFFLQKRSVRLLLK